jgi:hypothetical protein
VRKVAGGKGWRLEFLVCLVHRRGGLSGFVWEL